MNEKVLEILRKEAHRRNEIMKEVKMEDGTIYFTCGKLNIHKLVKTALTLMG